MPKIKHPTAKDLIQEARRRLVERIHGSYDEKISKSTFSKKDLGIPSGGLQITGHKGRDGFDPFSIQKAIDRLPKNPGGLVWIAEGAYNPSAEITCNKTAASLVGSGTRSTTIAPTGNIHVLSITPSTSWLYNIEVRDFGIVDASHLQTNKAAIYLDQTTNDIVFFRAENIYLEGTYRGIATPSSLSNVEKKLHTCKFRNVTVEGPRSSALYLLNAIDTRADDIYVGMSQNISDPVVVIRSVCASPSMGSYFKNITFISASGKTTGDGLRIDTVNEIFVDNVIVDSLTGNGVILYNAARNRLNNIFPLALGGHGIYITGVSDYNIFRNVISEGNGGYGIHDLSGGDLNFFLQTFLQNNVTGQYNLKAADELDLVDIANQCLSKRNLTILNNGDLGFIDTLGVRQHVLTLGSDNKVRLESKKSSLEINPDSTTPTNIATNTSGDISIGGGTTKPSSVAIDVAAGATTQLRRNGVVYFEVADGIDFHDKIIYNPYNVPDATLSGTPLMVQIDVGGVPYYFKIYPTKT